LGKVIASNPSLVQQIGGVYQFNVSKDGKTTTWTVDLKNGKGSVAQGAPANKADCTLNTDEDSFVGMMTGKLNSQQLFMQGKLKIQGNMGLAMKLNKLQQAKAKL
jgi:sterol carrier protein 2